MKMLAKYDDKKMKNVLSNGGVFSSIIVFKFNEDFIF